MASRWMALFSDPKLVLALPSCFLLGYVANDYHVTSAEYRQLEAERVSKRMGTWMPPPLSPSERATLMVERAQCLKDIEHLQARLERVG